MSIIQDALRRKEPAPAPPPAPALPPQPTAFPPPPLPPEHARRPTSPLLIVVMIAAVVGGGAFFAYRSGVLQRVLGSQPAGTPQARSPQPEVSVSPGDANVRPPPGSSNLGTGATATLKPTPGTDPGIGPTNAPACPPDLAEPGPAAVPVPATTSNAAPPAAKPAVIRWPAFVVRGVIAGKAGAGSVILDKALIDVGQSTPSGLRVVGLAPDGVVLEFQGQQRTFSVGSGSP